MPEYLKKQMINCKKIYLLEIDSWKISGAFGGTIANPSLSSIKESDLLNFTTPYYHYF